MDADDVHPGNVWLRCTIHQYLSRCSLFTYVFVGQHPLIASVATDYNIGATARDSRVDSAAPCCPARSNKTGIHTNTCNQHMAMTLVGGWTRVARSSSVCLLRQNLRRRRSPFCFAVVYRSEFAVVAIKTAQQKHYQSFRAGFYPRGICALNQRVCRSKLRFLAALRNDRFTSAVVNYACAGGRIIPKVIFIRFTNQDV